MQVQFEVRSVKERKQEEKQEGATKRREGAVKLKRALETHAAGIDAGTNALGLRSRRTHDKVRKLTLAERSEVSATGVLSGCQSQKRHSYKRLIYNLVPLAQPCSKKFEQKQDGSRLLGKGVECRGRIEDLSQELGSHIRNLLLTGGFGSLKKLLAHGADAHFLVGLTFRADGFSPFSTINITKGTLEINSCKIAHSPCMREPAATFIVEPTPLNSSDARVTVAEPVFDDAVEAVTCEARDISRSFRFCDLFEGVFDAELTQALSRLCNRLQLVTPDGGDTHVSCLPFLAVIGGMDNSCGVKVTNTSKEGCWCGCGMARCDFGSETALDLVLFEPRLYLQTQTPRLLLLQNMAQR